MTSLPRWTRNGILAIATFIVLQAMSSGLYALELTLLMAAGVWLWRHPQLRSPRLRIALLAVMLGVGALVGNSFSGAAATTAALPGTAPNIDLPDKPTRDDAARILAIAPQDANSWKIAASVDDTTTPTSRGTVELEQALVVDVNSPQAGLVLSALYLQYGGPVINAEIAAFYTALAGYPAPPGINRRP